MKTKYKFLRFTKKGKVWKCYNNKGQCLGYVDYYSKWNEHLFCAENDPDFSYQCLLDIADFLMQLNKEKK